MIADQLIKWRINYFNWHFYSTIDKIILLINLIWKQNAHISLSVQINSHRHVRHIIIDRLSLISNIINLFFQKHALLCIDNFSNNEILLNIFLLDQYRINLDNLCRHSDIIINVITNNSNTCWLTHIVCYRFLSLIYFFLPYLLSILYGCAYAEQQGQYRHHPSK